MLASNHVQFEPAQREPIHVAATIVDLAIGGAHVFPLKPV